MQIDWFNMWQTLTVKCTRSHYILVETLQCTMYPLLKHHLTGSDLAFVCFVIFFWDSVALACIRLQKECKNGRLMVPELWHLEYTELLQATVHLCNHNHFYYFNVYTNKNTLLQYKLHYIQVLMYKHWKTPVNYTLLIKTGRTQIQCKLNHYKLSGYLLVPATDHGTLIEQPTTNTLYITAT